jgi:hypothetical protein
MQHGRSACPPFRGWADSIRTLVLRPRDTPATSVPQTETARPPPGIPAGDPWGHPCVDARGQAQAWKATAEMTRNELVMGQRITDCTQPAVRDGARIDCSARRWETESGGLWPVFGDGPFPLLQRPHAPAMSSTTRAHHRSSAARRLAGRSLHGWHGERALRRPVSRGHQSRAARYAMRPWNALGVVLAGIDDPTYLLHVAHLCQH